MPGRRYAAAAASACARQTIAVDARASDAGLSSCRPLVNGMSRILKIRYKSPGVVVRIFVVVAILGIFLFDIFTVADAVSICFLYLIPIMATILDRPGVSFVCAAATTALSIVGSFIQPPGGNAFVFIGNRAIAVVTQWLAAALVKYRQEVEAALRSQYEAERQKSEQRRRFLDILSHELNTPLTTISGQAHRMIKLAQTARPEELAIRAGKIRDSAGRIVKTIERIQLASELGDHHVHVDFEPVDLRLILRSAAEQAASKAGAPAIEMDLERLPERIEADRVLLQETFENLIGNAVKYSSDQPVVRLSGWVEDGRAVVSVTDRGVGIPAEDLPMLGQPYYRAKNSLGISGTGLGLYLVQRFVAAHDGGISVDSDPGVGTTVTVRLPISRTP